MPMLKLVTRTKFALAAAGVLAAGGGAVACATNPVTGKSQISLVSEAQEIQMGQEANQSIQAQMGLVQDPALQSYVSNLGKTLAANSERPNLPWEFHVVDDPIVNAFALPGGFIYVTRGLLSHVNNEAELVSVLGHEIGHVTYRHSVSQISKQQLAGLGLGIGSILSPTVARFGNIAAGGLQLLFLKYGRDAERESDLAGFRYSLQEGYDVREMASVFNTLSRVGQLEGGGGGGVPSWLSTHPDPESRAELAIARADSLSPGNRGTKVNREEYLQRIQGLTFGEDPRQGYFDGGTFYHPGMRFQFTVPQGWQTQNTAQAVLAGSPQQDALFQMTLGQGTPQAAAQQFFSQQGLQAAEVGNTTINGNQAVSGYFQAQTEQGVLRGLATFVGYGGGTFMLLGYAPAERFASYDATFRQTMGSFRQLTDQSRINVQPAKVELVRLTRAMSLEEFYRQYPSTVPIERIAVINEVEAGAQLQAGRSYKRVVGGMGTTN